MISIIVRAKNEEKWITSCLSAIFRQNYKDFEVILVDNNSTDKTVEKARTFGVKVVTIDDYLPGKAINLGIRHARGDRIAILSAHCIPTSDDWLGNLARNLEDDKIAGVYGRQEPMSFSTDQDKRDLFNTFGLDKRVQVKDTFFHNANSMIRKEVWERFPFDEEVTNIEDRVWAKQVLAAGYNIIYEPEASVYHWHGIHQNGDQKRCRNVVRILESLQDEPNGNGLDLLAGLEVLAIIPEKEHNRQLAGRPLLDYTIARATESRYINRVVVSTDNPETARLAEQLGAEAPFLRPPHLSAEYIDITTVYQYTLERLEEDDYYPDIVVLLQTTFPFRPVGFIDRLIKQLVTNGQDSVLAVQPEYKSCWVKNDNELKRIDRGFIPRQFKDPLYIGLSGLATVTHPGLLRNGDRFGEKIGFVAISDPACALEVRDAQGLRLAEMIMPSWWQEGRPSPEKRNHNNARKGSGRDSGPWRLQGIAAEEYPATGRQTALGLLH